jgi:hypothetical protein
MPIVAEDNYPIALPMGRGVWGPAFAGMTRTGAIASACRLLVVQRCYPP